MERWSGKLAVVTGASSGIGRSIAIALAQHGMHVVAVARSRDRLEELEEFVRGKGGKVHVQVVDLRRQEEVENLFSWIESTLGAIHVLINNAGISIRTRISDGEMEHWRHMFELNVFAVGMSTSAALKSMKLHKIKDGHIININSVSGHPARHVPESWVYASTKHALTVLSEGLRRELIEEQSNIRVTSVSPGVVKTNIFEAGGWSGNYDSIPSLSPDDVSHTVINVLSAPQNVLISEIFVRPMGETI